MNNENPLVPQGSLLEQKTKSRSRVKTAFFCVLAVHVLAILTALIAQGCKREQPPVPPEPMAPVPTFEPTNQPPVVDTNLLPVAVDTNVQPPMVDTAPPPVIQAATGTEHVIAKGDSFYSIGKKYGVTMKAIADANPGVDSSKLKIGQKIKIPAATAPAAGGVVAPASDVGAGTQTYTVKSGDTLTKIAAQFGVTIKALRSANNLATDRIKVGDKLKIPVKAAAPAPAPAPVAAPVVLEAAPIAPPAAAPPR
jgi:LysM repeat protein